MSLLVATVTAMLALPQEPAAAHWAYAAPVRPTVEIGDGDSAIDALLAPHHRRAGLEPTPLADRTTLIRRLSLDLIGLPPSPEEIDAFVADHRPGAYERLVDRLLASPHYGERWASLWLDLARYGDTNGFNFDSPRSIWPYRDWVIEALNRDLPFDRFTLEQIAGDMLPDADERTRVATGFHRNTMLNNEGGVDAAEARWERLLDRAETTATVWLGSTFQCARCHDHKFDPIRQTEFYGLVAFFETQDEVALECEGGGKTLVMRERDGAEAATHNHVRGAYDAPSELVTAHTPAALHPWPAGAPKNRVGLAQWLVAPDNPLVLRVHVNRLWDALFGEPLARTPEDFGMQAERPPLLDLLDWLAVEFRADGLSQKRLLRTIVLSKAYRRSGGAGADQRAIDAQNLFYARGSRFRLDAERIRDSWLRTAGLLSDKLGGPSVYPLQADTSGVIPMNKVSMKWPTSKGEDRWRRGLYTYWRRTAPFVMFTAFDAPSREQCEVRRQRSNTPLQALVGLNDPTAVAAAEALAQRMCEHAGDDRARLAFGFRLCTARRPDAQELDRLQAALAGEPAAEAWSRIAIALLNLD
ncbi:MAG: DUF1549 domain-containing protein, partial [Planctomycetes bacterium]|nr:DUF1549 domain-containing protein [Planctomycetota bacterium]